MKKIVATGMSLAMALSLAACGGSSSGSSDTTSYIYSSELTIKNLDSADSDDGMSFTAMHACIDGMMGVDENGVVVEALADHYEVSDDGLTYTYTLKDGLKWSNGTAVTANDFVYAAKRIFKNVGNYYYLYGSDGAHIVGADELSAKIDEGTLTDEDLDTLGIKAIDDQTVEYTLTSPVSFFNEFMAFPCFYPINEEFAEEQGSNYGKSADSILCNGAFVMDSWEVGKQATYSKNADYWNADAVKLDTLILQEAVEPAVGATAFDNGEVDFAVINSSLVDGYSSNEAFQGINDGYLWYLSLNFEKDTIANQNVRYALSYAIDRDDLCASILKDGSNPATGFTPSGLANNAEGTDFRADAGAWETCTYDLEKAQEYLDKAKEELGTDEITIDLLYGTDENIDDTANYLKSSFEKLDGLTITTTATTKQDRIYNKQTNGDYDICITRWGPDYADPTTYLTLAYSTNTNNYGKYNSAAYDELIDKVNTEADVDTRWQLMKDAEAQLASDMGFIPVFEKGTATLQNTSATGLVIKSVGVPYTFNYVSK